MSIRWILVGMIAVVGIGAIDVNSLTAQTAEKPAKADKLVRVTYPIKDIAEAFQKQSVFNNIKRGQEAAALSNDAAAEMLKRLITTTVAAKSWEPAGGEGDIQYFPYGAALVIRQTQDVQEEIARLLDALRRRPHLQIQIEVRFLEVSAKTSDRLISEMKKHGQPARGSSKSGVTAYAGLDDKQTRSLLEMVQGDNLGVICQAPKITLDNGQSGAASFTSNKAGTRFDVSSLVTSDRRSVRLTLDFEHGISSEAKSGACAIRSSDTFTVPADRTLIWRAGEVGGMHVFVAATPRIVGVYDTVCNHAALR